MCGRISLTIEREPFETQLGVQAPLEFAPRSNLAPRQAAPILRYGAHGLEAIMRTWGFTPNWNQATRAGDLINARAETLLERPTFRGDVRSRRCIAPISGWYEWTGPKRQRIPYHLASSDERILTVAGILYELSDGSQRLVIVTTRPQPEIAFLHDRMPLLLDDQSWRRWLEPELTRGEIEALLEPKNFDLQWWPDGAVSHTDHNHVSQQQPLFEVA
jgi:putative SOS response-associated peptidase YedK